MAHRVVVTGMGVVSPVGQTAESYWSSLTRGTCGIARTTLADPEKLNQKFVAEVKNFDPLKHFEERIIPTLDRVSQFAVVAAREAIANAKISFNDPELADRTATIIGTGAGGQTTQEESYKRLFRDNATRVYPLTIPKAMVNAPISLVSMFCGLRGPAFAISSACASATHAIGVAFHMVRSGSATCALTGGTEATITHGTIRGWEALRVMAPDVCRPFSKDRKGMIIGEGAAIIVLETLEHAQERGAEILGEIIGFGMSSDAKDITNPDEGGMIRAIKGALADARLSPQDVQYINAHGTGTVANDVAETNAIKGAFGAHASKLAISSTKSMVGHALGAAGGLEMVACLMAVKDAIVPPTINYLGPDPACDLDCVPNEARKLKIDAALSNSFAFGGLNAVMVVKRFS
jgi:nodulation protein E